MSYPVCCCDNQLVFAQFEALLVWALNMYILFLLWFPSLFFHFQNSFIVIIFPPQILRVFPYLGIVNVSSVLVWLLYLILVFKEWQRFCGFDSASGLGFIDTPCDREFLLLLQFCSIIHVQQTYQFQPCGMTWRRCVPAIYTRIHLLYAWE